MNIPSQNIGAVDYYFWFLEHLDSDSKLDLISKLLQSMKTSQKAPDVSLQSLFGAYQSDETADELIGQLRASRVFDRNTEIF